MCVCVCRRRESKEREATEKTQLGENYIRLDKLRNQKRGNSIDTRNYRKLLYR